MKGLIFSSILLISLQSYASFEDWLNKAANKVVGLDTSIAKVENLRYYRSEWVKYFDSSVSTRNVTGRLTNNSKKDTIKTVVFFYEILECVTTSNCITIDEDEERWNTNIPPGQTRYFDHSIAYKQGDSKKDIYFRQTIKYLYPYRNM